MRMIMENKFREYTPKHSVLKQEYKNYTTYKKYLIEDFHHRCGYCHDHDKFFGGTRNYQIDHFVPKTRFRDLETKYDNLIYSCPFCNRSKWDKWVGTTPDENIKDNKGFVHPCDDDYEKHFIRNEKFEIIPTDEIGQYMYKELCLYLKRHSIINFLDRLDSKIIKIKKLQSEKNVQLTDEEEKVFYKALYHFHDYFNVLNDY